MPEAVYVYVGNADSQDISVFRLSPDGALTAIATVPVPGPDRPGASLPMAVSADKSRLYVGLRNEPYAVASFAIDSPSGKLAYIGSGPLPDSMCYIAVDATGRYLAGASYGGNKVSVSRIGDDGVVGDALQIVPTDPSAHCVRFDPSNRYVLHTSLGGGLVYQQTFDAETGALTPNTPPSVRVSDKGGPRHLMFSADDLFVYVLNELDAAIHVFPWDASNGTMSAPVQAVTALPPGFTGKPWAADIQVTPDGKFLYASERTSHTLAAFKIDAPSGRLTAAGSFATEQQPRGIAIDPSSRFVLSSGQLSDSVTVHAIDPASGALTTVQRHAVGKNPNWIEIVSLK